MNLYDFAFNELKDSGFFDEDSDYNGNLGNAVMDLIDVFHSQGHSNTSAHMVLFLFNKLARYERLNPLKNPMLTGEYVDVSEYSGEKQGTLLQSTKDSSVFSSDGGKTWYHLDKNKNIWQKFLLKLLGIPGISYVMELLPINWYAVTRGKVKFP